MTDHINKACNAAFYHLHNLRRIKKYLSRDSLITLVHAFITSRLDYCNGLLFGLPKVQIAKLRRVQNAPARLILGIGKFSYITPALYELHWLPVSLRIRINYKILLLTFKCYYGLAPTYLSDLFIIQYRTGVTIVKEGKIWVKLSTHGLPHDFFTDFYRTFNLPVTLRVPWRGRDVLKVPVTCKLCKLCRSILWSIVRNDNFRNSMPAKLHFQLLNNNSGICHVKLIHLEGGRIIINSNQALTLENEIF